MQVQVHFTCNSQEEFDSLCNKFTAPGSARITYHSHGEKAEPVAEETKKETVVKPKAKTLNQKLAEKEKSAPQPVEETTKEESLEETESTEEDGDDEVTFDNVKDAVLGVSRAFGRDAAVAVLAKFGATKVGPQIAEKDYAAVVAACKAVKSKEG